MSEISLIFVLQLHTSKNLNDMAKIRIKSEKLTPFGEIFAIMEQFNPNRSLENYKKLVLMTDLG